MVALPVMVPVLAERPSTERAEERDSTSEKPERRSAVEKETVLSSCAPVMAVALLTSKSGASLTEKTWKVLETLSELLAAPCPSEME